MSISSEEGGNRAATPPTTEPKITRQEMSDRLKIALSPELADFYIQNFPHAEYIFSRNKQGERPIVLAGKLGKFELIPEIFATKNINLVDEWTEEFQTPEGMRASRRYGVTAYMAELLSAPQSPLESFFPEYVSIMMNHFGRLGGARLGTKAFIELLKELFKQIPSQQSPISEREAWHKKLSILKSYADKMEGRIENYEEILISAIEKEQFEYIPDLLYFSGNLGRVETTRLLDALQKKIKQSDDPVRKSMFYRFSGEIIKSIDPQYIDKEPSPDPGDSKLSAERKKRKEHAAKKSIVFDHGIFTDLDLMASAVQDNQLDLFKYLITSKDEFGEPLHPIDARSWIQLYARKDPEIKPFLDLVNQVNQGEYAKDNKKVADLLETIRLNYSDHTVVKKEPLSEQEWLGILKLPFKWQAKDIQKLFEMIDEYKHLSYEKKYHLKDIFTKTRDLGKRDQVDILWGRVVNNTQYIDAKMFGHIHNDHALAGTHLEGSTLNRTMGYLQHFIDNVEKGVWPIAGLSKDQQKYYAESLAPLKGQLNFAMGLKNKIDVYVDKFQKIPEDKLADENKNLTEEITQDIIKELKEKKRVLIPGGWLGPYQNAPGHAMLYELKIEKGKVVFLIHNTGAGITNHAQKQVNNTILYSSVKAFEWPLSEVSDLNALISSLQAPLTHLTNTLLRPQYTPAEGEVYDEEKLYSEIAKITEEIGLSEVEPSPYTQEWTAGQLSGTCTWQVLGSFLKSYPFTGGVTYHDIRYEVKKHSLYEFLESQRKTLDEGAVHHQMSFATQNLARQIQRLSASNPTMMSPERAKAGLGLIQECNDAVQRALQLSSSPYATLPQYAPSVEVVAREPAVPLQDLTSQFKATALKTEPISSTSGAAKFPMPMIETGQISAPLLVHLKKLLEFAESNESSGYIEQALHDIESFFLKVPLSLNFWRMEKSESEQAITALQELQHLYGNMISKVGGKPLPARQLTLMGINVAVTRLLQERFKNTPEVLNEVLDQQYEKVGEPFRTQVLSSGFFSASDPALRIRANEISSIYCPELHMDFTPPPGTEKTTSFYHALFAREPDLTRNLAESCDKYIQEVLSRIAAEELRLEYSSPQGKQERIERKQKYKNLQKASPIEKAVYYFLNRIVTNNEINLPEYSGIKQSVEQILALQDSVTIAQIGLQGTIDRMMYQKNIPQYGLLANLSHIYLLGTKIQSTADGRPYCGVPDAVSVKYTGYHETQPLPLSSTVKTIANLRIKNIIEMRPGSTDSNKVQVLTLGNRLTDREALLRSLKNMKVCPDTQITATVDFMKRSFFRLNDPDIQTLIMLNLFEAEGYKLENQLIKTPGLIYDLLEIAERGIEVYTQKNKVKNDALFFMRLALSVQEFVSGQSPENKRTSGLDSGLLKTRFERLGIDIQKNLNAMEEQLADGKLTKDQNTKEILWKLHAFNIMSKQFFEQAGHAITSAQLDSLLGSILFVKNQSLTNERDPALEQTLTTAVNRLTKPIKETLESRQQNQPQEFSRILNHLATQQGVVPSKDMEAEWKGTYPWYHLQSLKTGASLFSVNLLGGQIIKQGMDKIDLPKEVYEHYLYRANFGDQRLSGFGSPDRNLFTFEHENVNYRMLLYPKESDNKDGVIQREFEIDGHKKWYEYCYSKKDPLELPRILKEAGMGLWGSVGEAGEIQDYILFDSTTKQKISQFDGKALQELDVLGQKTGFQLLDLSSLDKILKHHFALSQFEDKEFILAWVHPITNEIRIKLPRYQLEFKGKIQADGSLGELEIEKAGQKYKVSKEPYPLMPGVQFALQLEALDKTQSNRILIPEQRYYATAGHEGEYFHLEFDRTGLIQKKLNGGLDFSDVTPSTRYTGTQTVMECLIPKSAVPGLGLKTTTPHESLYLSYLYIANRHPWLAKDELKKMLNQAPSFTAREIEDLRRIIHDVPVVFTNTSAEKKRSEEARIKTPEFVGVRSLAYANIVNFKLKGGQLKTEEVSSETDSTQDPIEENRKIKENSIKNLEEFWEDSALSAELMEHMISYIRLRKKIPPELQLDETQELNILRYVAHHQKSLPVALEHRQRSLEYKQLIRDKSELEKIWHMTGFLTPEQEKKLERLDLKIARYPKTQTFAKTLMPREILLLPGPSIADFSEREKLLFMQGKQLDEPLEYVPAAKLSSLTSPESFLYSFQDYYEILKNDPNGPDGTHIKSVLPLLLNKMAMKMAKFGDYEYLVQENLCLLLAYLAKDPSNFPDPPLEVSDAIMELLNIRSAGESIPVKIFNFERVPLEPLEVTAPTPTSLYKEIPLKKKAELPPFAPVLQEACYQFQVHYEKAEASLPPRKVEDEILRIFSPGGTAEPMVKTLYGETEQEYREGIQNNRKYAARKLAANSYYMEEFHSADKKSRLDQNLKKAIDEYDFKLETADNALKKRIVQFANQPPSNPALLLEWEARKKSLALPDLSFEQILHLFLKKDASLYHSKTALNETEMSELQHLVFQYLIEKTNQKYYERVKKAAEQVKATAGGSAAHEEAKQRLGMLLSMKRSYDPYVHPEILLFEYLEEKILYPEQVSYIQGLIQKDKGNFISQMVKLIMGGGKSKILLPLLALEKANGSNLVVMEVPEALFKINHADLDSRTQSRFGQKAHEFLFDDTTPSDARSLLNMKRRLISVIRNREYLVTTRESLQSFELKFLKLLRYGNAEDKEVANAIKYMSDILSIFKNQGDFLIDEVDSVLDVKRQLIYATGKVCQFEKPLAKMGVEFFQFLDHQTFALGKLEQETFTLQQIRTRQKTPSKEQWPLILGSMADKLIQNPESPLRKALRDIFPQEVSMQEVPNISDPLGIKDYLLGKSQTAPPWLDRLTPEQKELIGLYKCQLDVGSTEGKLNSLLALTLTRKPNEDYGFPKDPNNTDELLDIAIPYLANDTPSEKSRFKNSLETMNYTLLLHWDKDFSEHALMRLLKTFKALYDEEQKHFLAPTQRRAEKEFEALTNLKLDSIDLNNPLSVKNFYESVKKEILGDRKEKLRAFLLTEHILPHIQENEEFLVSDPHNHCGQARSLQGMTGTDWNKRALPKSLAESIPALKGSDGQVMDYILRPETPAPHVLEWTPQTEAETLDMAIDLLKRHPSRSLFHAWIDLGAHFRGISNSTVAHKFAQYFKETPEFAALEYVLYFEASGQLVALKIATGERTELNETDPDYIQARLGVSPDKYFTYYDQRRTTGTDIKQAQNAHAFVSLGAKTLKRDLLQAVMRMRELRDEQRIEILVSKECQDANPNVKQWDNPAIVKMSIDNENERLAEDHFRGTLQEMQEVVRNDLLSRILKEPDVNRKQTMMKDFHEVFFQRIERSLFELYGGIKETPKPKTKDVLKDYREKLLKLWDSLTTNYVSDINGDKLTIGLKLQDIIDTKIKFCPEEVDKISKLGSQGLFQQQVQVAATESVEAVATAEALRQETSYALGRLATPYPQSGVFPFNYLTDASLDKISDKLSSIVSRQTTLQPNMSGKVRATSQSWQFTNNIYLSSEFYFTTSAQTGVFDPYKKDGLFYLIQYDRHDKSVPPGHQRFKLVLLTPEQMGSISKQPIWINRPLNINIDSWVETPHQTLALGQRPVFDTPEDERAYQQLREQVAFFSGDTDVLYQTLDHGSWLADKTKEKLQFLERVVQPLHGDKGNLLGPLTQKAEQLFQVFPVLRFGEQTRDQKARDEKSRREISPGTQLEKQPEEQPEKQPEEQQTRQDPPKGPVV